MPIVVIFSGEVSVADFQGRPLPTVVILNGEVSVADFQGRPLPTVVILNGEVSVADFQGRPLPTVVILSEEVSVVDSVSGCIFGRTGHMVCVWFFYYLETQTEGWWGGAAGLCT